MTTLTATDLRNYVIGAWYLQSWESFALDGSDVPYPLGPDARGIIMYTPDGYMSAQIMRPDRRPFDLSDLIDTDKDELATAASGYMAYSGSFTVSDDGVIAHHVELSLLPNWIGGTQYRAAPTVTTTHTNPGSGTGHSDAVAGLDLHPERPRGRVRDSVMDAVRDAIRSGG
jgi:hypothetical protein